MFDAKPEDREKIDLYVHEIVTDHKPGPDGVLVAFDVIICKKKGSQTGWENKYDVNRLPKENPRIWAWVQPLYDAWKRENTIQREGYPLDAWPAITKGQVDECKRMGLFVVEDLANAHDGIRQKLGYGSNDIIAKAKAFIANKDQVATATKVIDLEKRLGEALKANEEAREMIDQLMAEKGKRPQRPQAKPVSADLQ